MVALHKIILITFFGILYTTCEVMMYSDGSVNADFEVICTDSLMTIYFNLTQLTSRTTSDSNRPYKIEFSGQSSNSECVADSTNTSLIASSFNSGATKFEDSIRISAVLQGGCGINEFDEYENIVYNQTIKITYGSNPSAAVIREEYDYYKVMCLRNRTIEVEEAGYNVTYRQTGYGQKNSTAPFTLALSHALKSGASQTLYNMGDIIRFSVSTTTDSNIKAVVQNCWATSDGTNNRYYVIQDRCIADPGTRFEERNPKSTKFDVEAFRFSGVSTSSVYVECDVRICLATDSDGECNICVLFGRKRRNVGTSNGDDDRIIGQIRSPVFYIVPDSGERDKDQSRKTQLQKENKQHQALFNTSQGNVIILLLVSIVFVVVVKFLRDTFTSSNKTKVIAGKQYDQLT